MKKLQSAVLAFAILGAPMAALADSESGLYIGGSLGNADIDFSDEDPNLDNFEDIDLNDDDTGYKVFLGYNFGLLPLLDLGVEASYLDFGNQEVELNDTTGLELEADALTLSGVVGFNLGPVGIFGKVGVIDWDSDLSSFDVHTSESGTDPAYGIGAKFQLGSLSIRAEYEIFDLDDVDIDVDYYSVGVAYTF